MSAMAQEKCLSHSRTDSLAIGNGLPIRVEQRRPEQAGDAKQGDHSAGGGGGEQIFPWKRPGGDIHRSQKEEASTAAMGPFDDMVLPKEEAQNDDQLMGMNLDDLQSLGSLLQGDDLYNSMLVPPAAAAKTELHGALFF
ncbi:hypothetical protein ABZP36_014004 [Zizania latifolia]